MKKRHKTLLPIAAGAVVYGIAFFYWLFIFDGSLSSKSNQPETASSKPFAAPTNNPEKLSKWLTDIQPAAGGKK